jgi:hypothetical protein
VNENDNGGKEPLSKERAQALGQALASSLGNVTQMWEQQMSMLLAIAAILAAMPQTAEVDAKKVGATIHLMSSKQKEPEKLRDETTRTASRIIDLARRLREADLDKPAGSDGGDRSPSAEQGSA